MRDGVGSAARPVIVVAPPQEARTLRYERKLGALHTQFDLAGDRCHLQVLIVPPVCEGVFTDHRNYKHYSYISWALR